MTGEQLKNVRTGKGMTRAAFATWLGGTTASTLNKWERGISAVPEWVDRRIASPDELVLPIDLIGELMADAEAHKIAPVKSLAEALRVGLAARKSKGDMPRPSRVCVSWLHEPRLVSTGFHAAASTVNRESHAAPKKSTKKMLPSWPRCGMIGA